MKFIALCVIIVAICGQTSIQEEQSVLEMFPAYKDYKVKLDNRIRVIEAQMQQMKIKLEEIGQSLRSFLPCADNWVEFEGSCYLLQASLMDWNNAKTLCQNHGGNLAKVDNSREVLFIERQMAAKRMSGVMLGLSDIEHEGTFTWIDGSSITFNKFANGRPNNNSGQKEFVIILNRNNYEWITYPASASAYPLCEKKK